MNPDKSSSDTYRETALERGRPTDPCECLDCDCELHTYPDDMVCIWCLNGDHRSVEPETDRAQMDPRVAGLLVVVLGLAFTGVITVGAIVL